MKQLFFLVSFYLLFSPTFGQTSKPPVFVIPPKIKGKLSEIQIKFLLITLDDSLSSYFDVSPPPQNKSGECLTGCNFFQLEIDGRKIEIIKNNLSQNDLLLRHLFIKVKKHQELPTKLYDEKK